MLWIFLRIKQFYWTVILRNEGFHWVNDHIWRSISLNKWSRWTNELTERMISLNVQFYNERTLKRLNSIFFWMTEKRPQENKKKQNVAISKIGIMLMTGLAVIIQAIGHIFIFKLPFVSKFNLLNQFTWSIF